MLFAFSSHQTKQKKQRRGFDMNYSGITSSCCRFVFVKACTALALLFVLFLYISTTSTVVVSAWKTTQRRLNIPTSIMTSTPTKTSTRTSGSSSSSPTSVILANHHHDNKNHHSLSMTTSKSDNNNNNDSKKMTTTAATDTTAVSSSSLSSTQRPRDIMFQIGMIVGQLCQIAMTELPKLPIGGSVASSGSEQQDHTNLIITLTDLFITLCQLSDSYDISIVNSIQNKMILNNQKYPVELCKGKAGKYTQYSHLTGITKTNQVSTTTAASTTTTSTTSSDENDNKNNSSTEEEEEEESNNSSNKSLFLLSKEFSSLADEINEFAVAREWSKYHTPRNLVLALVGEMGELAELLQWDGDYDDNDDNDDNDTDSNKSTDEKTIIKLSQEIADCTIYAIRIATVCDGDGNDVVSRIQQGLASKSIKN